MRSNFINQGDSIFLDCIQDKISDFKIFNPIVDPNCNSGFRSKIKPLSTLLFTLVFSVLTTSCNKDSDLLLEHIINKTETAVLEEEVKTDPTKETIILTSDFNWESIGAEYANANWEITEVIDLEHKEITVPQGVIMSFKGGLLKNGTLIGDDTGIVSSDRHRLFDGVDLAGSFSNEFIKPFWFGAIMDGVTDDRDVFVETLKQATEIKAKLLVDQDIFLDVEETGKKSIFLEDNAWIEGISENSLIINNSLSPAFFIALSKNVTFKNINILWDQEYDITTVSNTAENVTQLKSYLEANRGLVFSVGNPAWKGAASYRAIISINGSENVFFENVKIKAKGETANKFIYWVIKFVDEFAANQTITNELTDPRIVPNNIQFKDVVFDGTIMGMQGIVHNLKVDGLKSYRYTDYQTESGENVGGIIGSYAAPPHLFYLNDDSSPLYHCMNNQILNVIDYGQYVGSPNVRKVLSGYCNSLKLTDTHNGVHVENYKSYRRDGFADIGNINDGVFKNIYSESISDIFQPDFKFPALRFLGNLNNVNFENMTIKDKAEVSINYPMDYTGGNNVLMDNINIYVNELNTSEHGCFGIWGSNNTVKNSSLNIVNHTSKEDYKAVIFVDGESKQTGSNNHYDIIVNGWRNIDENPEKQCIRMLLTNSSDLKNNYAKVTDLNNNFIIEQSENLEKDFWKRKEIVNLGEGSEQKLEIYVPNGFYLEKANATVIDNLKSGVSLTLQSRSNKYENVLTNFSNTSKTASKILETNSPITSGQSLYIIGNKDFDSTGKIEINIELIRIQEHL